MIGENEKHVRKLKRIGKQIDELLSDVRKEYPNAQITSLDGGGLYILDGALFDDGVRSLTDLDVLYYATCNSIQGGAV